MMPRLGNRCNRRQTDGVGRATYPWVVPVASSTFAARSGALALPPAALLGPRATVTIVDVNAYALAIAERRAARAGLTNQQPAARVGPSIRLQWSILYSLALGRARRRRG